MANPAAITTYTTLTQAMTEYLLEKDVGTNDLPLFVRLAEQRMNSELRVRQMTQDGSGTLTAGIDVYALPADYLETVVWALPLTSPVVPDYMSPEQWELARTDARGIPKRRTVIGTDLYLNPPPDADYAYDFFYLGELPALVSNSTNGVLTAAPLLYLAAALVEAFHFYEDDAQEARWEAVYQRSKMMLEGRDRRGRYGPHGAVRRV